MSYCIAAESIATRLNLSFFDNKVTAIQIIAKISKSALNIFNMFKLHRMIFRLYK